MLSTVPITLCMSSYSILTIKLPGIYHYYLHFADEGNGGTKWCLWWTWRSTVLQRIFSPAAFKLSVPLGSASAIWPEVMTFPGQPALDRGTKYKDPAIAPRIIPRWNNSDG